MKKGFTLVELLAVIVILAIIAIITIPMISNVIEKSKLGAMEDSAYGLIEAANYYYAEHMNEMSSNKLFVIENGNQTSEEKLNYKGKIEGNAKVLLASNGKVALCLTNGKSYAKKEITDTKVVMNTVSSDTTCEINGLENDSDITIDISGSNSSYYNKNEIDDKLNDLEEEIAKASEDLSKLNTTNKDSLVDAINEISNRVNELDDKMANYNTDNCRGTKTCSFSFPNHEVWIVSTIYGNSTYTPLTLLVESIGTSISVTKIGASSNLFTYSTSGNILTITNPYGGNVFVKRTKISY